MVKASYLELVRIALSYYRQNRNGSNGDTPLARRMYVHVFEEDHLTIGEPCRYPNNQQHFVSSKLMKVEQAPCGQIPV